MKIDDQIHHKGCPHVIRAISGNFAWIAPVEMSAYYRGEIIQLDQIIPVDPKIKWVTECDTASYGHD